MLRNTQLALRRSNTGTKSAPPPPPKESIKLDMFLSKKFHLPKDIRDMIVNASKAKNADESVRILKNVVYVLFLFEVSHIVSPFRSDQRSSCSRPPERVAVPCERFLEPICESQIVRVQNLRTC